MKRIHHVAVLSMLSLALTATTTLAAEPNRMYQPHTNDIGIWKSYTPKGLRGEFHNYDPVGLMAGDLIHTDCSINYTDPDTKKTYCFNSATSQVYFSNWPKTYAAKAAKALKRMKDDAPAEIPTQ